MLSAWRLNVKAGDVEFVIEIVNVPHNAVGAGMPAKTSVQALQIPGLHRMLLAWPATPLRGASQAGSARGAGAAIPL